MNIYASNKFTVGGELQINQFADKNWFKNKD